MLIYDLLNAYTTVYDCEVCLVSRSQTAFFSFVWGRGKKGSGERSIAILFWLPPGFGDSTARLLIGVKDLERLVDRCE